MNLEFPRRTLLGAAAASAVVPGTVSAAAPRRGRGRKGSEDLPVIDVHAHSLAAPWVEALQAAGIMSPDRRIAGGAAFQPWSPELAVETMDRHGIASSILSMPMSVGFAGAAGPALARKVNEFHAEARLRHPGRFGAFAILPSDIDAAIEETVYALDVLKLDGIGTFTNVGGTYLGDPGFDTWFSEMNRRHAVLFVHPAAPAKWVDLGFHISIVEFMAESTRMLTNLVFSGRRKMFPDIRIISTHGGGTIPYLAQRIGWLGTQFGPGPDRTPLTEAEIHAGLASFYYDLTASTSGAQLDALLRLVPHTQLLVGNDLPIMSEKWVDVSRNQLAEYDGLTGDQLGAIFSANAKRLFPLLRG